jgi:hypothetical protein
VAVANFVGIRLKGPAENRRTLLGVCSDVVTSIQGTMGHVLATGRTLRSGGVV